MIVFFLSYRFALLICRAAQSVWPIFFYLYDYKIIIIIIIVIIIYLFIIIIINIIETKQ